MKLKYFFTQISGVIVGSGAMLLLAYLYGRYRLINVNDMSYKDWLLIGLLFLVLIMAMILWGRLLVLLGILTKEEAKGYPYSKPWAK